MEKLYFILPPALPFPPVKGGAVETLLDLFVMQNEKKCIYDITVFSLFDKEAEKRSIKYIYTKVVYIDNEECAGLKNNFLAFIKKTFVSKNSIYTKNILGKIKTMGIPDLCIVEGGNYRDYVSISNYIGKKRMAIHIHAISTPRFNANRIYGHFIFVSDAAKNVWEKKKRCNGYVLYNAVNEENFSNRLSFEEWYRVRKGMNISEKDFVVLYSGRLIEEKGILELLKAIKQINYPNIKLVIVGSSNFKNAIKTPYQKELEEEMNSNIIFTGYIDNVNIFKYYQVADVIVSPSIWEEAGSLVNIEAIMSGKALITTSQGGNPEYVNPRGTLMIDYHEDKLELIQNLKIAIEQLYNDRVLIKKMEKENTIFSNKFSGDSYFVRYQKIINSILK